MTQDIVDRLDSAIRNAYGWEQARLTNGLHVVKYEIEQGRRQVQFGEHKAELLLEEFYKADWKPSAD